MSLGSDIPSSAPLSAIFSCGGLILSKEEAAFFHDANPFGFILFGRNIETSEQVKTLCAELRESVGWHCPILIDQEGGRVQRMKPPVWPGYPAMQSLAHNPYGLRGAISGIAQDLSECDIDVNCAPVLDVLCAETHDAIGDRAFSDDVNDVIACADIVCTTLLDHDITPVIKHIPGQGRAKTDSHKDLPRIDASLDALSHDFTPFKAILEKPYADQLWAMTTHIIYDAIDPDFPSSASAKVIDVIRGEIGFDGLLLSDDLDMDALNVLGDIPQRAKATLEAGCDIALYCWADINIMEEMAKLLPSMGEQSLKRYERSRIRRRSAA